MSERKERQPMRFERVIAAMLCGVFAGFLLWVGIVSSGCAYLDEAALEEIVAGAASQGAQGGSPDSGRETAPASSSPVLEYRFGGFKGAGAQEVSGCRIGSLKVSSDKLTYKWVKGGCETLGARSIGDYSQTVACAFYQDGDRWIGGKFDWISTSRTSRSFENIKAGYNGWDANAFFGAKRHGFCIVSKDGRKRSNFIED